MERKLKKKDGTLFILQLSESMNRNSQPSTEDHTEKRPKKMLKRTVCKHTLRSALTKKQQVKFIQIFEAASDVSQYITLERQFLSNTVNNFKTDASVRLRNICDLNGNFCEVFEVGSKSAEGHSC